MCCSDVIGEKDVSHFTEASHCKVLRRLDMSYVLYRLYLAVLTTVVFEAECPWDETATPLRLCIHFHSIYQVTLYSTSHRK